MSSKISTQVPIWLSVKFLESVLRKSENDESISINNVTSKAASASGDNYLSEMIRVTVEYNRDKAGRRVIEKKSLIFKIAPKEESSSDVAKQFGAFEKEIKMMENTLVAMNDILNENNYRLCAHVLYTKIEDPSFLVIEDLAELGFTMANRQAGLDLQHCLLVMRAIAKFHASSVAVYEKDPNSMGFYDKGFFHDDRSEELKKFCRDSLFNLGNEVANWTELNSCYSEKLLKLSKVSFEKAIECARPRNDEFNVLTHGDCWVNNMLFRYDDVGKVVDHIFVDFQLCAWTSPAIDLIYFLSTSPMDDVLAHHYDTLLDEYAITLERTMSRIGCMSNPPSAESLRRCLRERELFAVILSGVCLPVVLVDKTAVVSVSELLNPESNYVNPTLKGQLYRKIMVRRLKAWNSQGLLDV